MQQLSQQRHLLTHSLTRTSKALYACFVPFISFRRPLSEAVPVVAVAGGVFLEVFLVLGFGEVEGSGVGNGCRHSALLYLRVHNIQMECQCQC